LIGNQQDLVGNDLSAQRDDQMNDDVGGDCHVTQVKHSEFTILAPTLALLSCANHRAMELGGGFERTSSGWKLHWPEEVVQGFGLSPSKVKAGEGEQEAIKVLFEATDGGGPSFWSALFSGSAPALVVCYEVSDDKPPLISTSDAEWLHWPWQFSEDERLASLEGAIAAFDGLTDRLGWANLAMQAATAGPRSILFKAVKEYLERGNRG
jgi:hypothetical protein